jgi:hypothetical protein
MRRRARPWLRSSRGSPGGSISLSPAAHGRLAADSAGATRRRSGVALGRRVLGPTGAPASQLACAPAALARHPDGIDDR